MIGNVIHTFGSKLFIGLISFLMLLLNARFLGAEGLSTVGLIVLNITIVLLISNLVSGSIIYYSSRLNNGNLVLCSYLWSIVSVFIFYLINQFYALIEPSLLFHICLLSFIHSAYSIHQYILMGKEKIKMNNILTFVQTLLTIIPMAYLYLILDEKNIHSFIISLYTSYVIVWLLSVIASIPSIEKIQFNSLLIAFRKTISYGFYNQAANTFQLLNYRISYFFLDAISGKVSLGIYTAGVQISEALLLPGRSISKVQYARISRRRSDTYAQRISLFFMKISFLITTLGVILILLFPTSFYTRLIGNDFEPIKSIILAMSVGILSLSAEAILSQYFSGTGRQRLNTLSSFIGFLITLAACYLLIPHFGAVGAALASSISYIGMFLFYAIIMKKHIRQKELSFFPQKKEWLLVLRFVRFYKNKRKN